MILIGRKHSNLFDLMAVSRVLIFRSEETAALTFVWVFYHTSPAITWECPPPRRSTGPPAGLPPCTNSLWTVLKCTVVCSMLVEVCLSAVNILAAAHSLWSVFSCVIFEVGALEEEKRRSFIRNCHAGPRLWCITHTLFPGCCLWFGILLASGGL